MPIETKCTKCGRTLRVPEEHAGGQARCPVCQTLFTVPAAVALASASPSAASERWYLQTPEGLVYGPASKAELDRWLQEGRIAEDCQVREGDGAEWRPAGAYYSVLRPPPQTPQANPVAERTAEPSANASGSVPGPATKSYLVPHRGPLILIFGVLGWMFPCPIFSVVAWTLGTADLREMRAGRMDPGGLGLTQAGQILGLINAVLWLAVCVVGLFLFTLTAVFS